MAFHLLGLRFSLTGGLALFQELQKRKNFTLIETNSGRLNHSVMNRSILLHDAKFYSILSEIVGISYHVSITFRLPILGAWPGLR